MTSRAISCRMIDHLEIQTPTPEATLAFYAKTLSHLGYRRLVEGPAVGFGDGTTLDLFIREGEPSTNVHFAFQASSRSTVDEIFADASDAGFTLDRSPALMPQIHPSYYAGFLRDPDGRLIEFVCHTAES